VVALPQIIDALRAKGYEFVSVSSLIGKNRAQVMLPLSAEERFEARADGFIFTLYQWFRFFIGMIFILGIVLVSGRAAIIGLLALIEKLRPDQAVMPNPPPSVTVLIRRTMKRASSCKPSTRSCSRISDLRIIVVDDGSTDKNGRIAGREFFAGAARPHHSSSESRQSGGAECRPLPCGHEFVVTIDADTEIESDAISKLIRHFSDPQVGAVAGNVKVGNRSRWLTRWQALEYITSRTWRSARSTS